MLHFLDIHGGLGSVTQQAFPFAACPQGEGTAQSHIQDKANSTLGSRSRTHGRDQGPLAGVSLQRAAMTEGGAEPIKPPMDRRSGPECWEEGWHPGIQIDKLGVLRLLSYSFLSITALSCRAVR